MDESDIDIEEIKQELYSLYKTIIKNNSNDITNLPQLLDISSYPNLSLITNIKK